MEDNVKIKSIINVTHNVLQIITEKPADLDFTPGQATEVSINKEGWRDEKRPFTFTCLPENNFLEFTIKTYPDHMWAAAHDGCRGKAVEGSGRK